MTKAEIIIMEQYIIMQAFVPTGLAIQIQPIILMELISYIEIPASPSLAKIYSSKEITISANINIRDWYNKWNVFPIFEQYDPKTDFGATIFEANWASGGILFISGYNTDMIGCNYNWDFNTWHHLAVTYSMANKTAKFYVDGVLTCTKPYSQNFTLILPILFP